jgi:hypothetical protein
MRRLSSSVIRMISFLAFSLAEVVAGLIWRCVYDGDVANPACSSAFLAPETLAAGIVCLKYRVIIVS